MKTTTTKTIAILTIVAVALTASTATAGGNKKGGFSISFGGGSHSNHNFHHNYNYNRYPYVVKKVYVAPTCYRPQHCYAWVLPCDTWYTIAQREYGNSSYCHYIASYNGLTMSSPLVAGQQIRLPEIYSNGSLAASNSPQPAPFVAPQAVQAPLATPNAVNAPAIAAPAAPTANVRPATDAPALPSVAIGSMLVLDGQSFGEEQGIVRLRIGSLALPVEVLEWSTDSAKVRLPEMDLASAMRAEIEVLRADGSLASKSAIQLTPAATRLALGN